MSESEKKSTTQDLTEQQIIELHKHAVAAVPFLNYLFSLHQARTLREFQNAKPEHTKEIMWLKSIDAAMQQINQDFLGIVTTGEQLIAQMHHKNSPARKEQDRLNKQGFGL